MQGKFTNKIAHTSKTLYCVAMLVSDQSIMPTPASDRHHDPADLLVRLQEAVGLDDFLERERPGDDRLEASVGEPLVDESLAAFQASRVARDFHQHVAADREPPAQDVEHGERCRLRAQGTVEEDRPTRAQREMGHGMDRGVRELAVEPVGVQGEARDSADRVTDLEALDARPDRGDGPRRLVTQAGGELGSSSIGRCGTSPRRG